MIPASLRQSTLYHARRRRKGLFDPASALFRTHTFTDADTDIDTADSFGDEDSRLQPVTFAFSLSGDDAGEGLVFEFGSEDRGVAVWVDGNDIGVAAGASADEGYGLDFLAEDALPERADPFKFVLSVIPGLGLAGLWRNGQLLKWGQTERETFNGAWADDDNGAIGDSSGTVNTRVPMASRTALAGVALVGFFSVYLHQVGVLPPRVNLNIRLLETGDNRLLEDGGFRRLE